MSEVLSLPPRPNLERYKKLARDLQSACKSGDSRTIRQWVDGLIETVTLLRGKESTPEIDGEAQRLEQRWYSFRESNEHAGRCALAGAQLFLARAHGFPSWPKFACYVKEQAPKNGTVSGAEEMPDAEIVLPQRAEGLVLFVPGSEGRHHPRNRYLADVLHRARLGTVLPSLLTEEEELADIEDEKFRFDVPLLSSRIEAVTGWIRRQPKLKDLRLGYLGTGTGAASALRVASDRRHKIHAAVSLGGRPDLAGPWLGYMEVPTLFIAGNKNPFLLGLTRSALSFVPGATESHLEVIGGASHALLEEDAVGRGAELARDWFCRHLLGREEIDGQ